MKILLMTELLIYPKNKKELTLVQGLLNQLHIKSKMLTDEQEDIALSRAMKEVNRKEFVSRESVMKKLRG